MKIVFLRNVLNVADAGDVKNVADGYARNYLIPHGLAVKADPSMMQQIEANIRARARQTAETDAEYTALASLIEGKEVTIKAKVGVKDRLYGSVTAADIATALEEAAGAAVDKRNLKVAHFSPPRDYTVNLRDGQYYLKVTLVGVVEEESALEFMADRLPMFDDEVISYLHNLTVDDLRSTEGLDNVKKELLKKVNGIFTQDYIDSSKSKDPMPVKMVLFKDLVWN